MPTSSFPGSSFDTGAVFDRFPNLKKLEAFLLTDFDGVRPGSAGDASDTDDADADPFPAYK